MLSANGTHTLYIGAEHFQKEVRQTLSVYLDV